MSEILRKQQLVNLLEQEPPLVEGLLSVEDQVQPTGIDLSLKEVAMLQTAGIIAESNRQRVVSDLAPLVFDGLGYLDLLPGPYMITYNEIVHLPPDIMARGAPRSSLLRCGVAVHTAVWDAGYSGRSQSLIVVHNPLGFRVQRNARMMQLVFWQLAQATEGYNGTYQNENM